MADSTHIINRPRKFPPGCGPKALNTGVAFRPQNLVQQLPKTPNLPVRAHNRVQQRSETPNLPVVGSGNRAHKQVQQPSETANLSVVRNSSSRDKVYERVQQPSETANLAHKRVQKTSQTANIRSVRISSRDRVLEVLNRFRQRCKEIHRSNRKEPRPDLKALPEFKNISVGDAKSIGSIPGVEVGQVFWNRAELIITGVHGRLLHGIDYTKSFKGKSIATCVVAKEGYYDKMNDPDFLLYGGEGGEICSNGCQRGKKEKILKADQVMKRGNLALKNSIEVKNEVRVVRGVKDPHNSAGRVLYVYDGVYQVLECRTMNGLEGNMLFQFNMRRKPGQQPIDWKRVHLTK